jgi:hypothetical protein
MENLTTAQKCSTSERHVEYADDCKCKEIGTIKSIYKN